MLKHFLHAGSPCTVDMDRLRCKSWLASSDGHSLLQPMQGTAPLELADSLEGSHPLVMQGVLCVHAMLQQSADAFLEG